MIIDRPKEQLVDIYKGASGFIVGVEVGISLQLGGLCSHGYRDVQCFDNSSI